MFLYFNTYICTQDNNLTHFLLGVSYRFQTQNKGTGMETDESIATEGAYDCSTNNSPVLKQRYKC